MNINSTILASLTMTAAFTAWTPQAHANCDIQLASCLSACATPTGPCGRQCFQEHIECRLLSTLSRVAVARNIWPDDDCLHCPPEAIFEIYVNPWDPIFDIEVFAVPHEIYQGLEPGTLIEPGMFIEDLASQINEFQVLHFSHETGELRALNTLAMGESARGGLVVTLEGEALGAGELIIVSTDVFAGGVFAFGPAAN